MWQELPKFFDRNFTFGFLLPAAVFVASNTWLLSDLLAHNLIAVSSVSITFPEGVTVFGIVSVGVALVLAGLNYPCIRLLEGYYWPITHLKFLRQRQVRKRAVMIQRVEELELYWRSLTENGNEMPRELVSERGKLLRRLSTEFPDQVEFVLPTTFGNVVRAFEVYSRMVYGLDSIPGWTRLLAVIPAQFQGYISSAKARVDAAVNAFYLSLVFALVCIVRLGFYFDVLVVIALVVSVILASFAQQLAKEAAVQWGELIKAAFDVYICDLSAKLGHKLPHSLNEQRDFWAKISQTMIYGVTFESQQTTTVQEGCDSNLSDNTNETPSDSA